MFNPSGNKFTISLISNFVYRRGDSMNWDFVGRPPTPAGQGLCGFNKGWSGNHVSKVWRLLVRRSKTDEKFENQFFGFNFAKHELAKLLKIKMTTRDHLGCPRDLTRG